MSLFQSLTNTNIATKDVAGTEETPEAIGATALIQTLLEVTAFDACASKRNAFTTFSVISKARDLCKNIHTRIKTVDKSPMENWDAFVQYTAAIDPLEELLFTLVDWLEKEADKLLNETTAIKDAIGFIATWETNRTSLEACYNHDSDPKALEQLTTGASETSLAYADLQKHDDHCLISALCQAISETGFEGPKLSAKDAKTVPLPPTIIKQLAQVARDIKVPTSIDQASMTLAAKCAMIVQGALYLGDNAQDRDAKIALKAPLVWVKALSLLKSLSTHVSNTTTLKFEDLKTEYDAFLEFLNKLAVEIPSEYLDIILSVRNVKRPYHARTVELALQCDMLVKHFIKENKHISSLPPLEGALNAAVEALEAATSAMVSLTLFHYKTDDQIPGASEITTKFTNAQQKVKDCFDAYKMESAATALPTKMSDALKKDEARVGQMRAKFTDAKYPKKALSAVTLKIKKPDEAEPVEYSTDNEATLTAVLWGALSATDAATITQWHIGSGEKRLSNHMKVKDIPQADLAGLTFVHTPAA